MSEQTELLYTCREDKPEYVWRKYGEILKGKILDVGADQCGLRKLLPAGSEYTGIGLGGSVDIELNLETGELPFEDNSFDCVLCLATLEHLDNLHEVFDELCRVTRGHLIITLPNPWAAFIGMLRGGYYKHTEFPMKFYNLPVDSPEDRHKWFFGVHEAERFLEERGKRNSMEVVQLDREPIMSPLKRWLYGKVLKLIVHKEVAIDSLWSGDVWAVLVKR